MNRFLRRTSAIGLVLSLGLEAPGLGPALAQAAAIKSAALPARASVAARGVPVFRLRLSGGHGARPVAMALRFSGKNGLRPIGLLAHPPSLQSSRAPARIGAKSAAFSVSSVAAARKAATAPALEGRKLVVGRASDRGAEALPAQARILGMQGGLRMETERLDRLFDGKRAAASALPAVAGAVAGQRSAYALNRTENDRIGSEGAFGSPVNSPAPNPAPPPAGNGTSFIAVAAFVASFIPLLFGAAGLLVSLFPNLQDPGMNVSAPLSGLAFSLGLFLLHRGWRDMKPARRGSAGEGAFAGFLVGAGSLFLAPLWWGLVFESRLISLHPNTLAAALMYGAFGLAMLLMDKTRVAGRRPALWLSFLGYGAGIAVMILSKGAIGVLAGVGVMLGTMFASYFGREAKRLLSWLGRLLKRSPSQRGAAQLGALIGFVIGTALCIALVHVSPAFALAPILGVLIGMALQKRRT